MNNKLELIITIQGINFYKGNLINNGNKKERLIITDIDNYRIDEDEDIIKACNRIYNLWYV